METKKALILGAGGFIGSHLVKRLKREGFWVKGVDLKRPLYSRTEADEFFVGDLRKIEVCHYIMSKNFDEVYQLAADMGGAGYVFTGENDADIMHNSALINLNILSLHRHFKRIFYSSSACIYPKHNQEDPDNPETSEASAYPANPDSEYGWEKLFSERLYLAFHKNHGLDVRIARYHNIFGPEGSWNDGREKVIAALCRKIAEVEDRGEIEIWGDGKQTRSFLYIDECLDGTLRLMRSEHTGPFNIGSEEMVTIDELAHMISGIADKEISYRYIDGPQGVRGRTSDNRLIYEAVHWKSVCSLSWGLKVTYPWIVEQVEKAKRDPIKWTLPKSGSDRPGEALTKIDDENIKWIKPHCPPTWPDGYY